MKRDFIAELKARIKSLDDPQPRFDPPKPADDEAGRKPKGKRYNVHKRSLPPGIDRVVFYNVSKAEAALLVEKFLKPKAYQDDARDSKTVVYYDIVPVDAKPHERNIFFNAGPITKEEGSDIETPDTGMTLDEQAWIG